MDTYEATVRETRKEAHYDPYRPLAREEIIERLTAARKHAEEGKVMEAHRVSSDIRAKYGL